MQAVVTLNRTNLSDLAKSLSDLRIQKHLKRVENSLRNHTPESIPKHKYATRVNTLDNLNDYWNRLEFPINTHQKARTPVFKDELGNYCAVGFLLSKAGYDEYVTQIQRSNNLIRVNDINDSKYLGAISALGITKDEAARIQPSYGSEFYSEPVSSSSDTTMMVLQLAAVVLFIVLQLFAIFFFKELNLKRSQKIFGVLSIMAFSGIALILVFAITNLSNLIVV